MEYFSISGAVLGLFSYSCYSAVYSFLFEILPAFFDITYNFGQALICTEIFYQEGSKYEVT